MGRPRFDGEALEKSVESYFDACDATTERVILKNGSVSYRQIPYTLAGLSAHICMPKARIRQLAAGSGPAKARAVLGDAMRRIERHVVERALLGELQAGAAQLALRDLGCDTENADTGDRRVVVVLDDRERWGE